MSSIDGKISCDRCGEYNHERSMAYDWGTVLCIDCWSRIDDEIEAEAEDLEEQRLSHLDGLSDEELAMQPDAPEEEVFFPCDECGTMTAEHMLASIETNTGMRNCCPMCYSECFDDPRGISTEYTIRYLEVIKHEVQVTAMSRAQAERITLSGNKEFALRKTRLPQTIGKSIVVES